MNRIKSILFAAIVLTGCAKNGLDPGDDCSIQVSDIHFTKSLHDAEKNTILENDKVTIKSNAKTDYFNEPDESQSYHTAPILLTQIDNSKPFTFMAKVTPTFTKSYDAGAFYIFIDNDRWTKFAFEIDERGKTRIVTVKTLKTSDDNNHEVVTQQDVFLKISSDTKSVGFYFSTDNVTWNLARVYKNDYPEKLWLGISSQSPMGEGNLTRFENFSLIDQSVKDFRMGI
jgi:regulation of enolase protein 1 (concanavalin A-like superfamily)